MKCSNSKDSCLDVCINTAQAKLKLLVSLQHSIRTEDSSGHRRTQSLELSYNQKHAQNTSLFKAENLEITTLFNGHP